MQLLAPVEYFDTVIRNYAGDDCLPWKMTRTGDGYGQLWRDGRHQYVHRLACEARNGPPPTSKHEAAHSCGNGHLGCVNPKHLSWKTRAENAADTKVHGTASLGERHGCAILSERDVRLVRRLASFSASEVAAEFGVSKSTILHIRQGRKWGHVNEDDTLEDLEREARRLAARIAAKKASRA